MQVHEYVEKTLAITMIQEEKNYLKQNERSGDSTKVEKLTEYDIANIFKEAQEVVINKHKPKIVRDDNGNITRDGEKIKGLERTTLEGYLKIRSQAKAQER